MNIGIRPTFGPDGDLTVEAHLFDFDGDLYERDLEVVLIRRIRDEMAFESKDALAAADMGPEDIVRMNMYTTDVAGFMAVADQLVPIFAGDGCKPVSTLLGVTALFDPDIMIELEATAVA